MYKRQIIGSTGSGKSTLINLIPRFFDACEGKVLVDGVDVREQEREALRAKMSLTPQKALLFAGTVRENLQFAPVSYTHLFGLFTRPMPRSFIKAAKKSRFYETQTLSLIHI